MDARRTARPGLLPRRRPGQRGFLLIATYLLLSVFLVYSNAMVLHNMRQGLAMEQFRARVQGLDLAQGALEQARYDLHTFLTVEVYQLTCQGNAVGALAWLDSLGAALAGTGTEVAPCGVTTGPLMFDYPLVDINHDGLLTWADGTDGKRDDTALNPRCLSGLPTISADGCLPTSSPVQAPRAWIASVRNSGEDINGNGVLDAGEDVNNNGVLDPPGPLTPRLVTIEAEARTGSGTKHLRATYKIELGMSDIFRYGYFINNYWWFAMGPDASVTINGEVRSNGDLSLDNSWNGIHVQGDLYASKNPELNNPQTALPSTGTISGGAAQFDRDYYLNGIGHPWSRRPTKQLTYPGQPPIGGIPKTLPPGYGYDADHARQRFTAQPTQPMPYLGDLDFYKNLAGQMDSSLTYWDADTGEQKTISAVYKGPDGQAGTSDDQQPLVLLGTWSHPIIFDGPVVIPGDAIISGYVTGRGTIYAGRNLHILWGTRYENRPWWKPIRRHVTTGEIRVSQGCDLGSAQTLGTVCSDGRYYTPTETAQGLAPPDCIQ
ncbi:MAG: hypothetical protein HYZ92_01365 [Candidatus Omnitrophica bacterium]|nr:hypothetical protein [Candidatus Omnitrophota bacterium]